MRKLCIALLLTLAAGCGGEALPLGDDGAFSAGGAAGEATAIGGATGGAGGFGGQGGSVEPLSKVFVREDRFLCLDWPVCPSGVISPSSQGLREVFSWCRDMGARVNCGPCMDTRTPACAPFVGRCKAPNWPVDESPTYCADRVPAPRNVVDAFTICTGDLGTIGPDGVAGSDARTVCSDP